VQVTVHFTDIYNRRTITEQLPENDAHETSKTAGVFRYNEVLNKGLLKMIVGVLTICHTQYT
jgi:hypothetical protein